MFIQPLIWRWDGEKYRISNFAFSNYLLKDLPVLSDTIQYLYESRHFIAPSPVLWDVALAYAYSGHFDKADSVINYYWPEKLKNEKTDWYNDYKARLEKSPYRQQLLESK